MASSHLSLAARSFFLITVHSSKKTCHLKFFIHELCTMRSEFMQHIWIIVIFSTVVLLRLRLSKVSDLSKGTRIYWNVHLSLSGGGG